MTEALTNVSLGILDDVKFSQQTVEFVIVLSAKAEDVVWLKDGRQVAPSDQPSGSRSDAWQPSRRSSVPSKYSSSIDKSGLIYTLVVSDVHVDDEGIYTFVVRRPDGDIEERGPKITYNIEGSDQANKVLLLKSLAERKPTLSGATSTTNTGTGDR